jgi:hypothetical protein
MVLLQRLALVMSGLRTELIRLYAAMSNNVAMNVAWALMSLPPMFRTLCLPIMPFECTDDGGRRAMGLLRSYRLSAVVG